MNAKEKWAREKLAFQFRLSNPIMKKHHHPQEFQLVENMLYNIYGPPIIRLERSDYSPTGLYWKKYHGGVWARIRNQFLFKSKEEMMLARLYIPADYELTNKII